MTARIRPLGARRLLFGCLALAVAAALLRGGSIVSLFAGNLAHMSLMKAQTSNDPVQQSRYLDAARGQLASSMGAGGEEMAYTQAQLALAPVRGCPDDTSNHPPTSQGIKLSEQMTRELAAWIETQSAIPECLRVGRIDMAAAYYAWAGEHFLGIEAYFGRLPARLTASYVSRALTRYDGGDETGAGVDWARARSFLAGEPYDKFADIVEKQSAGQRVAQQRLLSLDLAAEPNNAQARVYLARSYNASGAASDALSVIAPLANSDQADAGVWEQYGQALVGLQRLGEAEAALHRATEIAPHDISALNRLGVLYLSTGRFEQAEEIFQRALAEPEASGAYWLWEHLGDALLAQGKRDQAASAYRTAITIAPLEYAGSAREKLDRLSSTK